MHMGKNENVAKKKETEGEESMALPWIVRMGYGVGHVENDLVSAMWFTYFLLFYEKVIGFSARDAGYLILIGQVADAFSTPVIGVLTDRGFLCCCVGNLGKKKAWYILGTVLVTLMCPFLYSQCFGCESAPTIWRILYYSLFIVLFQFGWAATQTVHLALASHLTPASTERTFLLSLRNTFTILCNITTYILAYIVLELTGSPSDRLSSSDLFKFQILVAILLVTGLTTSIFFIFTVKEDTDEALISSEESSTPSRPERQSYWTLLTKWATYEVAIIYMCSRIFGNVIQSLVPLYIHDTLELDTSTIAIVPLVMYLSGFLTSLLSNWMKWKLGSILSYWIGVALAAGGTVWVFLGYGELYDKYFIYIVAALLGGAGSILLVIALSVSGDLIGNDIGNSAFVYGLMSFTDKLSSGIVLMIVQYLKPAGQSMYYRNALGYICAVSPLVAALVISFLSLRTPSENEENRNEVRRENATVVGVEA